jgi:hypothetical protein
VAWCRRRYLQPFRELSPGAARATCGWMRLVLPVEVVQRQFASPQASRSLRLLTTHYWLPRKRPTRVTSGSASHGRKFPWHQSPSDGLYDLTLALHGQYPEVMVNGGRRGQPESLGEFLPG